MEQEEGAEKVKTRKVSGDENNIPLIGSKKSSILKNDNKATLPDIRDVLKYCFYYKEKYFSSKCPWREVISCPTFGLELR